MGALRFPGFGERLRVALIAAGYVRPSGKPDVPAFIARHGYDPRGFYPWLRGVRTPELDTLTRLAEALNVSRAWLLLGDGQGPTPPSPRPRGRKPLSIAGGSSADGLQALDFSEAVSLLSDGLRRWLHVLWYPPRPWAPVAVGA